MPNELRPYLLFALECYERDSQSIRVIGGLIIAVEDPIYVGRLLMGSDTVEDHSELVPGGRVSQRLFEELQRIGEQPERKSRGTTRNSTF
jgi:hypothetical protein